MADVGLVFGDAHNMGKEFIYILILHTEVNIWGLYNKSKLGVVNICLCMMGFAWTVLIFQN